MELVDQEGGLGQVALGVIFDGADRGVEAVGVDVGRHFSRIAVADRLDGVGHDLHRGIGREYERAGRILTLGGDRRYALGVFRVLVEALRGGGKYALDRIAGDLRQVGVDDTLRPHELGFEPLLG